jgi:dihydroxy-acid dehydratase
LAYVNDGNRIIIDLKERRIDLDVSDDALSQRKRNWKRVEHPAPRGALADYRARIMAERK